MSIDDLNLRAELLDEAKQITSHDRNKSYGSPEDNFGNIAAIWNAQLSHKLSEPLNATDVALLMTGMKLARLKHNPDHKDSWVDGAGYLACGYDTVFKPERVREIEDSERKRAEIFGGTISADSPLRARVSPNARVGDGIIDDTVEGGTGRVFMWPTDTNQSDPDDDVPLTVDSACCPDGFYTKGNRHSQACDLESVKRVADHQSRKLKVVRDTSTPKDIS